MANVSKNAEIRVLVNGQPEIGLTEWNDITIVANYENDNVQPSLSIDAFNFKLGARQTINQWVANGLSNGVGIFEGIPFEIQVFNNTALQKNFKGYLDFTRDFKDFQQDGNLSAAVFKDKGLDNFFNQLEGLTYGYLENIGVISNANYNSLDYVVEKKIQILELIMMTITTYILVKELIESTTSLIDTINKTTTSYLPTPTIPPLPAPSNVLYAILSIILRALYIALILVALINMGITLFELFIQPKRKHKMIGLKQSLDLVCGYLGYTLDCPSTFFNNVFYLPSNPQLEDTNSLGIITNPKPIAKGIPNSTDYGYNCAEMFELAKKLINGRFAIIGTTVVLRPKNDPFWNTTSAFKRNNVLLNQIEYNTSDLKPAKILSFTTDIQDEYTIDNFTGTNCEIRTTQINTINPSAVLLKGVDEVRFNIALGNRKASLNPLEKSLQFVGGLIDNITGIFGGGTSLYAKVSANVGALKVSSNYHSQPKLIYSIGGKLPTNYRTMLNAEKLYDDFHNYDSFVLNNFGGQKILRNNVRIPFGFNDFMELSDNAFCEINQRIVKINNIKWTIGKDVAEINYEYYEPYTKNLSERKIIA
jgi:hypothetical protein